MIPHYIDDFDLSALPMVETDVLVIGSGIAGLFTAIKASEQHRVLMISLCLRVTPDMRRGGLRPLLLKMIRLHTTCKTPLLRERAYADPRQLKYW
jgi:hypothetical protein